MPLVVGSTKSTLDEQFASFAASRFTLHCDLSVQARKQYAKPSVCATQTEAAGLSAFPVQFWMPQ